MEKKMLIHLMNEKIIEIEEDYIFLDNIFNKMNNNDSSVNFKNYIIPKSSIYYIEVVDKEVKLK